jgi:N-methylhydantoinase A
VVGVGGNDVRLAIDVGGTFTDVVLEDDFGRLSVHKVSSTPDDPTAGVVAGIDRAAGFVNADLATFLQGVSTIAHGTTRATNAILTGSTAKTAFITTKGHPDILLLRMGGREQPFNHKREYPVPYIPRSLTFEVDERMDYAGSVVRPLATETVEVAADRIIQLEVEAVGVCLLWSIANGSHEEMVRDVLLRRAPSLYVTLSHELNPIVREYHRASSTCIDASVKPLMQKYLGGLMSTLRDVGFEGRLLFASSGGGLVEPSTLVASPILSINSGPAMAPVAGGYYASISSSVDTAVVIDTGGTSFDVSVVRGGRIPRTRDTWLGKPYEGHLTGFPSVDVRTIGSGGGSIARVDSAGLLRVGPESAGAVPGPVCYGRGGELVTVTDACIALGYLDPGKLQLLGLDVAPKASADAIDKQLARPLGLTTDEAAAAVMRVLTEQMVHAVEAVTVEQGIDPRRTVMVSGGGAAGFNVVMVARRLGCPRIVVPQTCAAMSATGCLLSDVIVERARAFFVEMHSFPIGRVNRLLGELKDSCLAGMANAGSRPTEDVEFIAEARYAGQVWEIEVPLQRGHFEGLQDVEELAESFHQLHEQVFAVRDESSPVEVICWRARAKEPLTPSSRLIVDPKIEPDDDTVRSVFFAGTGRRVVRVVGSARLSVLDGPALLELPHSSIVLPAGARASKTVAAAVVIEVGSSPGQSAGLA